MQHEHDAEAVLRDAALFRPDCTEIECVEQCMHVLEQLHLHRCRANTTGPPAAKKLASRLAKLCGENFLDWIQVQVTKRSRFSLAELCVLVWCQLCCSTQPQLWKRHHATEQELARCRRKLRGAVLYWDSVEYHSRGRHELQSVLSETGHVLATYVTETLVANAGNPQLSAVEAYANDEFSTSKNLVKKGQALSEQDRPLERTSSASSSSSASMSSSSVTDDDDKMEECDDSELKTKSKPKKLAGAELGAVPVDFSVPSKDPTELAGPCPLVLLQTAARAWRLAYTDHWFTRMHVRVPYPLECSSPEALEKAWRCMLNLVDFEPSEADEQRAMFLICLWHCPSDCQVAAKRTAPEGEWSVARPNTITRAELGSDKTGALMKLSQLTPREILKELSAFELEQDRGEPIRELSKLQQIWILLGLNRVWASGVRDLTGRAFLTQYLLMPYEFERNSRVWLSESESLMTRRPLLMRLKGEWFVQYPLDRDSIYRTSLKQKFALISCGSLQRALLCFCHVLNEPPFHGTAFDTTPLRGIINRFLK